MTDVAGATAERQCAGPVGARELVARALCAARGARLRPVITEIAAACDPDVPQGRQSRCRRPAVTFSMPARCGGTGIRATALSCPAARGGTRAARQPCRPTAALTFDDARTNRDPRRSDPARTSACPPRCFSRRARWERRCALAGPAVARVRANDRCRRDLRSIGLGTRSLRTPPSATKPAIS